TSSTKRLIPAGASSSSATANSALTRSTAGGVSPLTSTSQSSGNSARRRLVTRPAASASQGRTDATSILLDSASGRPTPLAVGRTTTHRGADSTHLAPGGAGETKRVARWNTVHLSP